MMILEKVNYLNNGDRKPQTGQDLQSRKRGKQSYKPAKAQFLLFLASFFMIPSFKAVAKLHVKQFFIFSKIYCFIFAALFCSNLSAQTKMYQLPCTGATYTTYESCYSAWHRIVEQDMRDHFWDGGRFKSADCFCKEITSPSLSSGNSGNSLNTGSSNSNFNGRKNGEELIITTNPATSVSDWWSENEIMKEALDAFGMTKDDIHNPVQNHIVSGENILYYEDLNEMKVNMDIQKQPSAPEMERYPIENYEAKNKKREMEREVEKEKDKEMLNLVIDALEIGISGLIKAGGGLYGTLLTANISLWAELGRACLNPNDYIGWNGTVTIFTNVFTAVMIGNVAKSVGTVGKLANKVDALTVAESRALVKGQKVVNNIATGKDLGKLIYDAAHHNLGN
jgi:hypothetical protein